MRRIGAIAVFIAYAALHSAFAAASPAGEAFEIGDALSDAAFWKSDPVLFVKRHRDHGFKFTSETREGADSRRDGGVTCFGIPVFETRVAFGEGGGIARVELMLFNRGGTETLTEEVGPDGRRRRSISRIDKTISRAEFFEILKTLNSKLTPMGGGKRPAEVPDKTQNKGDVQRSMTWKSALPGPATMTWNYNQHGRSEHTFKPGFVRLVVDGPGGSAARPSASSRTAASASGARGAKKIAENVVRDSRGDVFVDNVPMVDQGMKGYCSAATAERVMRYYGLSVDEHDVAQAAGTTAEEGTNVLDMKKSVEAIGRRYKLATAVMYGDFEKGVHARIEGLANEARNYNKAAKKLKKPEIPESVYAKREGDMVMYDYRALDSAMDPEVLKDMKVSGSQKARFTKFMKDVRQCVDRGMPLFWGVKLGIFPETDIPQAQGGHMRLIIGYNDKKKEILYSDSWGKGHELKRMPSEWAWTISKCLMVMKPLQ